VTPVPLATATIADPAALIGTWSFGRTILDHRDGGQYTVTGRAHLQQDDDSIRWQENGTLYRDGGEFPVMRTLLLRPDRAAGVAEPSWRVEFDDGRPFHDWQLGSPVVHLCGADTYRGRITATDADSWQIEWTVRGPVKDYTMLTDYRRR
jgi:hypothetical protein